MGIGIMSVRGGAHGVLYHPCPSILVEDIDMWSDGVKCAVALSFDFDAETLWTGNFKMDHPTILARGEFGARVGVGRILRVLNKYDVKATFFVPGWTADKYPEQLAAIHEGGHELAHHGYLHENPSKLSLEQEKEVMEKGIESLKRVSGEAPAGYRTPTGVHSPNTMQLLVDYGFIYESSLMASDGPYMLPVEGRERSLVELPMMWELDDVPHFFFNIRPYYVGMSAPSKVLEIWKDEFDVCYEEGGFLGTIMHPQVSGQRHRVRMLERFIQYMMEKPGVWFARHVDVARRLLDGKDI
jgi:peptidoglycan/xylan/chitin deacetylase (PgdA/CDA1 family)